MRKQTLLILFCTLALITYGQDRLSATKGDVMFDGYDPVSYFDGNPERGKNYISTMVEGRKILFVSNENKERFLNKQERFFPEYGGWCAIAMVDGSFVIPDYSLYKIQEDRLLFFSVRAFFNGLTEWEKQPDKNLIKADSNFMQYFPGKVK